MSDSCHYRHEVALDWTLATGYHLATKGEEAPHDAGVDTCPWIVAESLSIEMAAGLPISTLSDRLWTLGGKFEVAMTAMVQAQSLRTIGNWSPTWVVTQPGCCAKRASNRQLSTG